MQYPAEYYVWLMLAPLWVGVVCALVGWLVLPWKSPLSQQILAPITFVTSGMSLLASLLLVERTLNGATPVPGVYAGIISVYTDALSVYFAVMINVIAWASSGHLLLKAWRTGGAPLSDEPGDRQKASVTHPAFYHVLMNGFHLSMLAVCICNNLIVMWIMIELTTLLSTLLVSFMNQRRSWEAAWKYLILSSIGIVFALYGTLFLSLASQPSAEAEGTMEWSALVAGTEAGAAAVELHPPLLSLAFLCVLIGFGTKAGFAPMHTWVPDAHGESPAEVSAMLSGVLIKSGLFAILRYASLVNAHLEYGRLFTSTSFLIVAMVTLLTATPFILNRLGHAGRINFKRILAYHSVEHMGIIAFGLAVGNSLAVSGALLHALNHAVTKAMMFLTYDDARQYLSQRAREARRQARPPEPEAASPEGGDSEITGLWAAMPGTGSLLGLGGLALVGVPPFSIFMSMTMILLGAVYRVTETLALSSETAHGPTRLFAFALAAGIVVYVVTTGLIFAGLMAHLRRLLLGRGAAVVDVVWRRPLEWLGRSMPAVFLLACMVVLGLPARWPVLHAATRTLFRLVERGTATLVASDAEPPVAQGD